MSPSAIRKVKSIKWKGEILRWAKYLNRDTFEWTFGLIKSSCSELRQASHTPLLKYLTFCSPSSVKRLPLTHPQWPAPPTPTPAQSPATWWQTPAAWCRWPARSWTLRNCSAETWQSSLLHQLGQKVDNKLEIIGEEIVWTQSWYYKHICLRWQNKTALLSSNAKNYCIALMQMMSKLTKQVSIS